MGDVKSSKPASHLRQNCLNRSRAALTSLHMLGVARLIDRFMRRIVFTSANILQSIGRVPILQHAVDPLLERIMRRSDLHFDLSEMLRVCSALKQEHVEYWIGGGWGIDILVGSETRRHGDLDVVVDNYEVTVTQVALLLKGLGYQRKAPLGATVWFPDGEMYQDRLGHRIEIFSINWDAVASAQALLASLDSRSTHSTGVVDSDASAHREQYVSTGELSGVLIPSLSVTAQRLFQLLYPKGPEDARNDEAVRLIGLDDRANRSVRVPAQSSRERSWQPSTLLLIPMLSFPRDLWRLCRLFHNDLDHIPPHVTLAFPFLPLESVTQDVTRRLTDLFAEIPVIEFELSEVKWFATNVVYLVPSKDEHFRSIIEMLKREFPDFHPYGDSFDSIIPHVTLSEHGSLADRRVVGRFAPKYLPITASATHVWMMSNEVESGHWSLSRIFQLGSTPVKGSGPTKA